MCLREVPRSQGRPLIAPEHLVAITMSWRRGASQRPTISSVRPTVSSAPPTGYTSAVSKKVMPPAAARSMMAADAGSSHCNPNVMVPRHRRDTGSPVRPRRTWRTEVRPSSVEHLAELVGGDGDLHAGPLFLE